MLAESLELGPSTRILEVHDARISDMLSPDGCRSVPERSLRVHRAVHRRLRIALTHQPLLGARRDGLLTPVDGTPAGKLMPEAVP